MKMSKKTAIELGELLADSLHLCASVDQRQAVLNTRSEIAARIADWPVQVSLYEGFNDRMDKLEPYLNGSKRL